MKIIVVGTANAGLFRFRGDLIKSFINKGHSVLTVGNGEDYIEEIQHLGAAFKKIAVNNNGMNVISDIKYIRSLKKVIKEEKPDIVFAYTIKPVLYSALITKKQKKIKFYGMFAGLGRIFTNNSVLSRIMRKLLLIQFRRNFKNANSIIFQNKEDRELLVEKKVINYERTFVVNGSGININEYPFLFKKIVNEPIFLHTARLMPQKGTILFLEAAARLKKEGYKFKVVVAGDFDRSFSKREKDIFFELIGGNNFAYLGKIKNVKDELNKANYVIYPSFYGEGVPRALLEALSCGKPIITSNRPGCKETVTNNNGWMIQGYSIDELLKIMKESIQISEKEYEGMCLRSRLLAEQKFDVKLINSEMAKIMGI